VKSLPVIPSRTSLGAWIRMHLDPEARWSSYMMASVWCVEAAAEFEREGRHGCW
jgi:hypothetical protein